MYVVVHVLRAPVNPGQLVMWILDIYLKHVGVLECSGWWRVAAGGGRGQWKGSRLNGGGADWAGWWGGVGWGVGR